MATAAEQADLFDAPLADATTSPAVVMVNARVLVRTQEGHRVVVAGGIVLSHYAVSDRMAESHVMVLLCEQGWAEQVEVARAFGCTTRTVRRHQDRFESGGLAALGRPDGYPRGRPRTSGPRIRLVNQMRVEGRSNRQIAVRLGVSEKAVRKLLRRLGWPKVGRPRQQQLSLRPDVDSEDEGAESADPNLSGLPSPAPDRSVESDGEAPPAEAPLPVSFDRDPSDRRQDRLFAYLGLLDDAAPLFRSGLRVPGAGVLLAIPSLVESRALEVAREVYGSIGPAFYGLRTTIVALVLMALLRIKRPEGLKEHPPDDLGRVLGLDRAPEVKTLRRKLARLASFGRATEFGRGLARSRAASRGAALGFLYVDGHVRAYHGRHAIPKAHVTRMRISMPATTDYWVGDATGEPLLVITAEANAGLVEMLPRVVSHVIP